jgi:hypothetical protein
MTYLSRLSAFVILVVFTAGCGFVTGRIQPTMAAPTPADIARLWQEPADLATRDVFHGPGGAALLPKPGTTFTFVATDTTGYSPGFDVRDAAGLEWSVKTGPEAQTEVVTSRILWALGYHQPPTYYVSNWTMTGQQAGPQAAGRFRPKLPDWMNVGEWDWYENDFINSQPFKGLIVANVMLNNWDWKTSNNRIYDVKGQRVYLVQDLGASLGKTSYPSFLAWLPMRGLGQGSRNDLEGFEEQGFIDRVEAGRVRFVYRGIHGALLEDITPADVAWAATRMSRLSDTQWRDIFRAAAFPDDQAQRYIAKIRSKIADGLKLASAG